MVAASSAGRSSSNKREEVTEVTHAEVRLEAVLCAPLGAGHHTGVEDEYVEDVAPREELSSALADRVK